MHKYKACLVLLAEQLHELADPLRVEEDLGNLLLFLAVLLDPARRFWLRCGLWLLPPDLGLRLRSRLCLLLRPCLGLWLCASLFLCACLSLCLCTSLSLGLCLCPCLGLSLGLLPLHFGLGLGVHVDRAHVSCELSPDYGLRLLESALVEFVSRPHFSFLAGL